MILNPAIVIVLSAIRNQIDHRPRENRSHFVLSVFEKKLHPQPALKSQKACQMKLPNRDRSVVQENFIQDPMLRKMIGTALLMSAAIGGLYLFWGHGPVIAVIPWFIPVANVFTVLTVFMIAYLAMVRYQVLGEPVSYWVGIAYAGLGIGVVFFILAFPGLLPDGRAILARLPNTSSWVGFTAQAIFIIFLLVATLLNWPRRQVLVGQRWRWFMVAWLALFILIFVFSIVFERSLPVLVDATGTFTPLNLAWNRISNVFLAVTAILALRHYLRSRDKIMGYVVINIAILFFATLTSLIGARRFDLWWILYRILLISGYLIIMFGLLSEYGRLFRLERESQAALQVYAKQLERTNRALQNFIVVASHDLQEPLRKIEAFGDAVLEDSSNLNERQSEQIVRMRKSARQMRDMVNGLLQLSIVSADIQPYEAVDLHQTFMQVLSALNQQIKQPEAVVEMNKLPVIEADPRQMRSLLQHLIENALKFQPLEGTPRVRVYSRQSTANSVEILVEDNGIGFDEAKAEHLFEPFERLVGKNQTQYGGIGIGLTICRWIVEHHGGEIAAHSKPGQGTTVIVTLPIQQPTNSKYGIEKDLNHGN
jgi:signal transduction histidine kinase